jgi:nucleoside-diphosphate-sugar epimerase
MYQLSNGYSLFTEDLEHIDASLVGDWECLRGAHLFITGGTGLFGRWLTEALLFSNQTRDLGLSLTILTRDPRRFRATAPALAERPELRLLAGRLTDFTVPDGGSFTHILHLASESNPDGAGNWAARHMHTALEGTRRVLDLAAAQKAALLLTSSGAVYGQDDAVINHLWVEGHAGPADYLSEKSVYGQSKRMMEIMTAMAAQTHGFRALITRCFAFAGPHLPLDSNYAIGNFIGDALAGRDIVVNGDGTPLRSYLYMADLVIWLLAILLRGKTCCPYNVGGDQAVSIAALARLVANCAGTDSKVVIKGQPVPSSAPSTYLPDLSRAETGLGLRVAISLEEGIRRCMAWHRQSP